MSRRGPNWREHHGVTSRSTHSRALDEAFLRREAAEAYADDLRIGRLGRSDDDLVHVEVHRLSPRMAANWGDRTWGVFVWHPKPGTRLHKRAVRRRGTR